jgi:Tfp pilus assembly protein PilO
MRSASIRPIAAGVIVLAAALAFWVLVLSPKREESDKLDAQIQSLRTQIGGARSEVAEASAAHHSFPAAYRQLVVLGQAVPSTDETPSLLIELEHLAAKSDVSFESIQLEGETEGGVEETAGASVVTDGTVPASEVEASLLPLGATIGYAGLAVMPYTLDFKGEYFNVASFIGKVDAMVKAGDRIAVDGRLITINSFTLSTETEGGGEGEAQKVEQGASPSLQASFSVTTYLTPPGQGLTGITPSTTSESSTATVAAE